jgi:16S rRNA (guanine966-N2)-methyltransferase
MTRIIAGSARGRRLAVPAAGTRPTSDRAREGLFNSLAAATDLDGARVLDLFAGTGAVGLEALSRGAVAAVFVESDPKAAEILRRNVSAVGLPGATVLVQPVARYLAAPPARPFDVVFADPPYDLDDDRVQEIVAALTGDGWLSPEALVVVERSARGGPVKWDGDRITPLREKRYGEGLLWYGRAR